MKKQSPFLLLIIILLQAATSIRVERVVVPPVVLAGRRVKLECQYEEDGDRLYSLKWWHGDDQFYQFIPPHRKHFPVPGVTVNWSATATLNEHINCMIGALHYQPPPMKLANWDAIFLIPSANDSCGDVSSGKQKP
ncbi:uncharacterized protein LOC122252074 [Penaeus japonicus]|uniref:uncharacterized protein LOC122252074 n=1 Tax=Penaeus japonicus TaxID=27405 RepID=UPI001C70DBAE|nr:uncharacterized protein LOC122252074 [Penaeus japonicus]